MVYSVPVPARAGTDPRRWACEVLAWPDGYTAPDLSPDLVSARRQVIASAWQDSVNYLAACLADAAVGVIACYPPHVRLATVVSRSGCSGFSYLGGSTLLPWHGTGCLDNRGLLCAEFATGEPISYVLSLVCVGASRRPAFAHGFNFVVPGPPLDAPELIEHARQSDVRRIAFVVPSGVTWALPIYELALLTAKRLSEHREQVELVIVTPEVSPLAIFGTRPSEAVGELLRTRGIEFRGGIHAREAEEGTLVLSPGDEELRAAAIVALPLLEGPGIEGLPTDQNGFIPIDEHARIYDADDLYAAGDGTNFPIKQGGLATQQADAAAEHIAARLGADLKPEPFHPILRGKLITGDETMSMTANVATGDPEGYASADYLWWPPFKVSGRYLTPWLASVLFALKIFPKEFYCQDCHFTWGKDGDPLPRPAAWETFS